MADGRVINVTELVDKQKFGLFHFKLMAWLFLILVLDGYDLLAASLAAPELIKNWHLAAPGFTPPPLTGAFMGFLDWIGMPVAPLTGALTSSLFGIMVGAIIFGWVGDRFGRKATILVAATLFSLATIGCALAMNLDELTIFRFLCGVGIGGVMPNTISLAAEMAPKGVQATLIILMFTGTPAGSSLPGPIAAWVVPHYGWQMIFWIGGIIPAIIVLVLIFVLPESIKFLAQDDRRRDKAAKVARQIDPSLEIGPDDRFVVDHMMPDRKASWLELFRAPFSLITPLLASLFVINFLVLYFMNNWIPVVIGQAGGSESLGIWTSTTFSAAGALGGVVLSRFVDKMGLVPVVFLFALAVPVIASFGYAAAYPAIMILAAALGGACVVGLQFGLNATSGMIYPTHIRSNGVGFCFGVGRFGAIVGPIIGGGLIQMKMPLQEMFIWASLPMAVGAIFCFVLTRLQKRAELG